jgi:hypothetical protein
MCILGYHVALFRVPSMAVPCHVLISGSVGRVKDLDFLKETRPCLLVLLFVAI